MNLTAAVIFDLDGCLVDSEPISLEVIATEIRNLGVEDITPHNIRDRFLGVSIQDICKHVSERVKIRRPDDFIDRVETRLISEYQTRLRQITDAEPLLQRLSDAGLKTALATGSSLRRMGATLEISGLAGYFKDTAFSASQVPNGKPAPDLFLLAAQKIGVNPGQCIVIEDSPHGIKGAIAAGMSAYGFVGGTHLNGVRENQAHLLKSAGASAIFENLADIGDAIVINLK